MNKEEFETYLETQLKCCFKMYFTQKEMRNFVYSEVGEMELNFSNLIELEETVKPAFERKLMNKALPDGVDINDYIVSRSGKYMKFVLCYEAEAYPNYNLWLASKDQVSSFISNTSTGDLTMIHKDVIARVAEKLINPQTAEQYTKEDLGEAFKYLESLGAEAEQPRAYEALGNAASELGFAKIA